MARGSGGKANVVDPAERGNGPLCAVGWPGQPADGHRPGRGDGARHRGERVSGVEDIQRLMVGEKIGVSVDVVVLRRAAELRLKLVPRELGR